MKNTSPAVDAYIAKAPDFAKPILEKLRRAVHRAEPNIEEAIKWSTPHFVHDGLVGGMASFKNHVTFSFWRGKELSDPNGLFADVGDSCMAALKVSDARELPTQAVLVAYVKEAVALNLAAAKAPKKKRAAAAPKKAIRVPADLAAALDGHPEARSTFDGFSPTNRREYVEWVTEAKRDATRQKRITTAVEWMSEGKPRNWKYMKRRA